MKHFITIKNKKYPYIIEPTTKKAVRFTCEEANIKQEFLREDIPALLIDLPAFIIDEQNYRKKKEKDVIRFRVSSEDKNKIEKRAIKNGYSTVSAYLRDLALG
ncbi:hypothetical protein HOE67_04595 [Candidatus Peregrinibacteria bacterium]|jgi:hypothetical protein|nr:hypothetical protein [Candidatus Peregrinibacteria bacterium]MBT4056360.1 hypothetical protein [Candidatus Peregrinibacteria bacterium]